TLKQVRGVRGDHDKVYHRSQLAQHLREAWIGPHWQDRDPTLVGYERHGAMVIDNHWRVAGVRGLRDEPLGDLVHASLEIHSRLRPRPANHSNRLHSQNLPALTLREF